MARTTTSGTGDLGGFTLLEILLALALIALLGTLFIGGSQAMFAGKADSLDDQFWRVCAAARHRALEDRQDVLLTYDAKARAFALADAAGRSQQPVTGPEDLMIDFHPASSEGGSEALVGGTLVETKPIGAVTFYADGTCTPFRAQVRAGGGAHLLAVDPWTCAPELSLTPTPDAASQ